ncbi:hypothetical protein [Alkalihalobacillus sp. LMS39]|uniref:hypothetical protein n=1 Tax=Alkalihalobacillus sp. LMS39 TaxID=2924032 RepID=UPI001FB380F7|nr:hypothetical protein [Alkalihalobacillus sp. LMS39]UOE92255.1 hypothetical protein MM271_13400 [Alkalihalobacillus sp. LMS39]
MKKKVNKKNLLLWVLMGVYALTLAIIADVYFDFFQANILLGLFLAGILLLLIFLCILSEIKKIHGSTKINKKVFFSALYVFIVLMLVISLTKI